MKFTKILFLCHVDILLLTLLSLIILSIILDVQCVIMKQDSAKFSQIMLSVRFWRHINDSSVEENKGMQIEGLEEREEVGKIGLLD